MNSIASSGMKSIDSGQEEAGLNKTQADPLMGNIALAGVAMAKLLDTAAGKKSAAAAIGVAGTVSAFMSDSKKESSASKELPKKTPKKQESIKR